jgi:pimeloyl-ACP methyl ester carboxylesterase
VEEAREHPEVFARKMVGQVTEHYLEAIAELRHSPAVVGHSFGGLIAQKIAGEGRASATVSIDNAPFQGVLALPPSSLKSAAPVLAHPRSLTRGVALTFEQFVYGWANNLDEAEARELYDTYHVPASGVPLFQAATANLNPFAEAKVDTKNSARGPLLLERYSGPRPLARDRFGLAGGCRRRSRVHSGIRAGGAMTVPGHPAVPCHLGRP